MSTLTCDSCTLTTENVQAAVAHVAANPDHTLTATIDDEGTTVTIGAADDDGWEEDDEL